MKKLLLLFCTIIQLHCLAQSTDTITCSNGTDSIVVVNTYFQEQCPDSCSGSYSLNVTHGSGSYDYLITSGAYSSTSSADIDVCVGVYDVQITDLISGIVCNFSFSVDELIPLTYSFATNDCTANGVCDGSAALTISGGLPPYQINWYSDNNGTPVLIPNENGITLTSLCAGTYYYEFVDSFVSCCDTCTVGNWVDPSGSDGMVAFDIAQPAPLVIVAGQIVAQCQGVFSGSASASASGGVPPYTYTLNGVSNSTGTFYVPAGFYTITVTDANSNTASVNVVVHMDGPGSVSYTFTTESCPGACDATMTVTSYMQGFTGHNFGSSFHHFLLQNNATNELTYLYPGIVVTGLCSGNYTIIESTSQTFVFVPSTSCPTYYSIFTIQQGAFNPNLSVTVEDETCLSSCDGSITIVDNSGGATQYNIGSGFVAGNTFENLCPDDYTISVTNASGCVHNYGTVTVEDGDEVIIDNVNTSPAGTVIGGCVDNADVSGGVGPYDFTLDGTPITMPHCGLTAGTYELCATDANGCFVCEDITIDQCGIDTSAVSIVQENEICANACNGSITIVDASGTITQFDIGSGSGPVNTFEDLCPADYTVSMIDVDGCMYSAGITTILEGSTVSLDQDYTSPAGTVIGGCVDNADVSGGVGPYDFTLDGTPITMPHCGLTAGTYELCATDANGCFVCEDITIDQCGIDTSAVSIVQENEVCANACNGSITILDGSGTIAQFDIGSGFGPANTFEDLCPADYTVSMIDSDGCMYSAGIITILEGSTVSLNQGYTSPNGTLTGGCIDSADVTGGVGAYDFTLDGTPITLPHCGLTAGTYELCAIDANGCFACEDVVVGQCTITINADYAHEGCGYPCNGVIEISADNGTGLYEYSMDNGASWFSEEVVENLCPDNYTITVRDELGCLAEMDVEVVEYDAILISTNPTPSPGNCSGQLEANVSGGQTPYVYKWSECDESIIISTNQIANNLCAGEYKVEVEDFGGCIIVGSCDTVQNTLSINDLSTNTWSIHPNPAKTELVITTDFTDGYQIQLMDLNGRIVLDVSVEKGSTLLNLEGKKVSPGVYIVQLSHDGITLQKRLVIE